MASSRETSNGPDWKDVAVALLYFQEDHNRSVAVRLTACGSQKVPDLLVECTAERESGESGEATTWVSVKSRIGRLNVRTLDAAILSLLHQLDFELVKEQLPDLIE